HLTREARGHGRLRVGLRKVAGFDGCGMFSVISFFDSATAVDLCEFQGRRLSIEHEDEFHSIIRNEPSGAIEEPRKMRRYPAVRILKRRNVVQAEQRKELIILDCGFYGQSVPAQLLELQYLIDCLRATHNIH